MNVNCNYDLKAKIITNFGTQIEFAAKIGVSELFVSQVVNNRRKLKPKEQKYWATALKCKPGELFYKN